MRELLYRKISGEITEDIISGKLTEGARLPGVRELAEHWDASANTVLKALDELETGGYIRKTRGRGIFIEPRSSWSGIAEKRSRLELILHDLERPFNRLIVSAVEKAAADSGYKLSIRSSESAELGEGAAGIIVPYSVDATDGRTAAVNGSEAAAPVIYTGEFNPPHDFTGSYIVADTYGGFYRAAELLLAAGRERIAYIGSSDRLDDEPGWNAVRDLLVGTSFGFNREYSVSAGGLDPASGTAAMERLLINGEYPDAVICGNDILAAGVYKACRAIGLSIPDDLAVIGAGDQDIAPLLEPPLTSLKFPAVIMGLMAVNYLEAVETGKIAGIEILRARLDMELVVRGSALSGGRDEADYSDDGAHWL
ncbi:MAG TPA: hypothetical protein DCO79_12800 [Spirochaeta sp.]|nr:hypothetical protein [Spirochaeta sp.]